MPEQFLHGVEVLEVSDGRRPIRTTRSSTIGLIGTAPNAAGDTKADAVIGSRGENSALVLTSKAIGALGNGISITLVDPGANTSALAITLDGNAITVSLATSGAGAITTTATLLKAAIDAHVGAGALVAVANDIGSSGAGILAAAAKTFLTGGVDEPFPLNTPVLIAANRTEAAKLGEAGTLFSAIDGIFDQTGAVVVIVRVAEGADLAATEDNIIGGVSGAGQYEGVHVFLGAESALGLVPRVLIAPGFTGDSTNGVLAELLGVANRLRAVIIADGPNTNDAAAVNAAGDFGSDRIFLIDPAVKVVRNGAPISEPASARVAGLIAKSDNERGFWWSPSNQEIAGIVGTSRPVDFTLGDPNTRANLLNEANVATIIRQDGFRLWGNRSLSADPKFAFLSVRRTADIINDSLLRAHLWAVDRNITKTYLEDVAGGVTDYMRTLQAQGAILGGKCWPDPDLNTPANIAQGKVFFCFDFTPPYPAEHITFKSILTNDYIEELVSTN